MTRVKLGDVVDAKSGDATIRGVVRAINHGVSGKPTLRIEPSNGSPARWVQSKLARVVR